MVKSVLSVLNPQEKLSQSPWLSAENIVLEATDYLVLELDPSILLVVISRHETH